MQDDRGVRLLEALASDDVSLRISVGDDVVFARREKGIAPLLEALETLPSSVLEGATVADVVVGKAGALLLVQAEVGYVASRIMSEAGAEVLRAHGIDFYAEKLVPTIWGRIFGQPCPFERAVRDVNDPSEALGVLSDTAERLARGR